MKLKLWSDTWFIWNAIHQKELSFRKQQSRMCMLWLVNFQIRSIPLCVGAHTCICFLISIKYDGFDLSFFFKENTHFTYSLLRLLLSRKIIHISLSLILLANKLMELRSYFMCIDGKSSNKNGSKLFLDLPLEFISEILIMYWVNSIIQRHTSFTIQTLVPCRVQGQYNSISIW